MAKRPMMTTKRDRPGIERLKELVEVHGANRERWPAAERQEMAQLVETDAQAAAIVAQAQALDRLLDEAPTLSSDRLSDLADRIVAIAQAEGQWQGTSVASMDAHARGLSTLRTPIDERVDGLSSAMRYGNGWRLPAMLSTVRRGPIASAAMLAASLMIGVFIGLSFSAGDVTSGTQIVADASDDAVLQQLLSGEESLDALVEDLL